MLKKNVIEQQILISKKLRSKLTYFFLPLNGLIKLFVFFLGLTDGSSSNGQIKEKPQVKGGFILPFLRI